MNGYLYVVVGQRSYLNEAVRSVESLRRYDPGADVTVLVTPELAADTRSLGVFDRVVERAGSATSMIEALQFRARHAYGASPYERTLMIDADTWFLADPRPLFNLLQHFEMAMTPASVDRAEPIVEGARVPELSPFNAGVILFRRDPDVQALFEAWSAAYDRHLAEYRFDQVAFMEALAGSRCRVFPLKNNWNVRIPFHEKLFGRAMLIHGRHHDLDFVAAQLNASVRDRVWVPWMETCLRRRMGIPAFLSALLRGSRSLISGKIARLRRT
jgi:hypothetical protein